MFESTINKVLELLSGYPIVQASVAILILLAGLRIMKVGSKDAPAPATAPHTPDYPHWIMSGPVDNAFGAIHELNNNQEKIVDLLREDRQNRIIVLECLQSIRRSQIRQIQLLEMIQNENVINPRRLRE